MTQQELAKYIASLIKSERDRAVKEALAKLQGTPVRVTRSFNGR
jgi:hypothetical protein